jgi:hypothetical protein
MLAGNDHADRRGHPRLCHYQQGASLNGRLANFSSGRLMRLLAALGQDVDIVLRAKTRNRERGKVRVLSEAQA